MQQSHTGRVFLIFALIPAIIGWAWLNGHLNFAADAARGLPGIGKQLPQEVGASVAGDTRGVSGDVCKAAGKGDGTSAACLKDIQEQLEHETVEIE